MTDQPPPAGAITRAIADPSKADRIAGIAARRARIADALTTVKALCETGELDAYEAGIAAERQRIRQALMERQAVLAYVATNRHVNAVLMKDIEDVLDGDTDGN